MRPGRFFWKLFLGNALLMAIVLIVSIWMIADELDSAYVQDLTRQLTAQAERIRNEVKDRFYADQTEELNKIAREAARLMPDLRVTMVAVDGTVWADSEAEPSHMEPHGSRKEVFEALRDGWGESMRLSRTVSREMKYVAVRVGDASRPIGVIRVSMPERGMAMHTATTRRLLWKIGGIGLGAALILALGLAAAWSAPIRRITETARTLSRGDLSARVRVAGRDEIGDMARSLNQMRDHLAAQLHTIDRQREDLDRLIRTLQEGVIVADAGGRIVLTNPAAIRLLRRMKTNGASAEGDAIAGEVSGVQEGPIGRLAGECVPNPALLAMLLPKNGNGDVGDESGDLARLGEKGGREVRLEFELPGGAEIWSARSTDVELATAGAGQTAERPARLVVLTDITELTRTIQVKTDFVANASHELRTPLSAIRAAVETLQQLDFACESASARQFVDVIERHSARLVELSADLLNLSSLESPAARFPPEPIEMLAFLRELHGHHAPAIAAAGLDWHVECPAEGEHLVASPQLLRLVLDNLVDNAVKFTEPGGYVRVTCRDESQGVSIEVEDSGCGIPEDQQDRVFERFYQVQRARSERGRDAAKRGTGLGLSIVRHAVAAMQGSVRLCSRSGEGTRVTIVLPRKG